MNTLYIDNSIYSLCTNKTETLHQEGMGVTPSPFFSKILLFEILTTGSALCVPRILLILCIYVCITDEHNGSNLFLHVFFKNKISHQILKS